MRAKAVRTATGARKTAADARAKAATAKSAVAKATGKALAAKSAPAKSVTAKSAPAKAAAKSAATKAAPAEAPSNKGAPTKKAPAKSRSVSGPAGAKVSSATPVVAGPAATKIAKSPAKKAPAAAKTAADAPTEKAASRPAAAKQSAAGQRPTPFPRTRLAPAEPVGAPSAVRGAAPDDVLTPVTLRIVGRHRRPVLSRRRPAMVAAAALVGALAVGTFALTTSTAAQAGSGSAVSVAHELGLTAHTVAQPAPAVASQQLGLLAASRAHREALQTAAAHAQRVADAKAIEAARPKAVLPVKGAILTSGFGYRWGTLHAGIDLAAPLGTPEYAVMDGVVLKAGPASGFGQAVYIQHANGDVTVYGHMEKILVATGQVVRAGQEIALLGAEGEATGPHLHFEVHVGGIEGPKIDPIPWLAARGVHV